MLDFHLILLKTEINESHQPAISTSEMWCVYRLYPKAPEAVETTDKVLGEDAYLLMVKDLRDIWATKQKVPSEVLGKLFLFFFLSFFLGAYLWHMEIPRLGVKAESELQLLATASARWDPSSVCDLHHSSGNAWSFIHWARPGMEPASSCTLVRFLIRWATTGTPESWIFFSPEIKLVVKSPLH